MTVLHKLSLPDRIANQVFRLGEDHAVLSGRVEAARATLAEAADRIRYLERICYENNIDPHTGKKI